MRAIPLIAILTAAVLAACGKPGRPEEPAGEGGHLIRGRILDAETGEPVSRKRMYLHFFCDEIDHQVSLDPDDTPEFVVRMPRAKVRLRAVDTTDEYHFLETTLTLEATETDRDIRLRPTHYVILRGRVIEGATGKPIVPTRGMGAGPLLSFSTKATGWRGRSLLPEPDGTFEIRVPRARLQVMTVNHRMAPDPPEIDLTGVTGATHAADIPFR